MQLSSQQFSDIPLFLLTGQQTVTLGPKDLSVKLEISLCLTVSSPVLSSIRQYILYIYSSMFFPGTTKIV